MPDFSVFGIGAIVFILMSIAIIHLLKEIDIAREQWRVAEQDRRQADQDRREAVDIMGGYREITADLVSLVGQFWRTGGDR